MLLMLSSWLEILSKECGGGGPWTGPGAGAGTGGDRGGVRAALLVALDNGGSRRCWGMDIVCRAIMVADGGVFSPRRALLLGRRAGVSLISNRGAGVGVLSFPK